MANVFEKRNYYFRDFPLTPYTLNGIEREVLDFIHRWKFSSNVRDNVSAYSEWTIRDEDSLRGIAYKLYGSEHYFWIVMMMNDLIDPFFDWPLNEADLRENVISIYGEENIYSHNRWESDDDENIYALPSGEVVSSDYPYNRVSINNYDVESEKNEAKRNIKLLKPGYLPQVKDERERILKNKFGRL